MARTAGTLTFQQRVVPKQSDRSRVSNGSTRAGGDLRAGQVAESTALRVESAQDRASQRIFRAKHDRKDRPRAR
jgi:hypothetical protein